MKVVTHTYEGEQVVLESGEEYLAFLQSDRKAARKAAGALKRKHKAAAGFEPEPEEPPRGEETAPPTG